MRKISMKILLVVTIVALSFYVVSCGSDDRKTVFTESEVDLEFDIVAKTELSQEKRIITFLGKDFEAEYSYSLKIPYFGADCDQYICEIKNDAEYLFCINSSTNEIVQYSVFPYNYVAPEGEKQLTRDQCYQIALEKLKQISKNYVYVLVDEQKRDVNEGLYVFNFVRKIDDLETADEIYISINCYGEMFSIQWLMQGSLVDVTEVDYNADEVNSAIDEKIKELYEDDSVNYTIEKQIIVKLKDESVGLECTIEVENGTDFPDTIKLFVEL